MFNKVLYGIITIILLVVIYITSLLGIIYERQAVVLERIIDESVETKDFTGFIKYSSLYYMEFNPTPTQTNDDYLISYFRTVEINRSGDTISQLIIFVMAEDVTMSETAKNPLDQTRLEVWQNGVKTYASNTDDAYKDFSISYGLRDQSFYYYNYLIESDTFEVKLFDYDGFVIEINTLSTDIIDLENETEIIDAGFQMSYTVDEIEDLLEIQKHYWKIYMYIGIFMVIDIAFAFFIFRNKS